MAKYCRNCGRELDPATETCPVCDKPHKKRNKNSGLITALAVLLVGLIIVLVIYLLFYFEVINISEKDTVDLTTQTTVSMTTARGVLTTYESEINQESVTTNDTAAGSGRLYLPDASKYITSYETYVFCTDTEVQDYVKMRYGPSKETYDVIQIIPNDEYVQVLSKSVNDWTLVEYKKQKGWVRTDFLGVTS